MNVGPFFFTQPNPPITYLREMQTPVMENACFYTSFISRISRPCLLLKNYVKGRECLPVIPVYCSGSNKAKFKFKGENNLIDLNVKTKGNEKYELYSI